MRPLSQRSHTDILLIEYACSDLVMYNGLVVISNDIDAKFLNGQAKLRNDDSGTRTGNMCTTILSSNGSGSRLSGLGQSPLMNVLLELLTSLMKICRGISTPEQRCGLKTTVKYLVQLLPDFSMGPA